MSTNNYSYENVLITVPDFMFGGICDECEENGVENDCGHIEAEFDHYSYDEYVGEVRGQLAKIGFEYSDKHDGDRNYGGTIISRYGMDK